MRYEINATCDLLGGRFGSSGGVTILATDSLDEAMRHAYATARQASRVEDRWTGNHYYPAIGWLAPRELGFPPSVEAVSEADQWYLPAGPDGPEMDLRWLMTDPQ